MYTISLSTEQLHPPISLSRLPLLDRVALSCGNALIRWVDRSQARTRLLQERRQRHEHPEQWAEQARLHTELEHRRALLHASTLYQHLR